MAEYLIFNNFLDFKKQISIRSISSGRREDWYDVSLYVNARVSRYYILQVILELIMYGNNHDAIRYSLKLSKSDYDCFLWEIKSIVGMSDKTVVFMRKNRKQVEERFNEYFAGKS